MDVANKDISNKTAQTDQKELGIPLLMLWKHDPPNYLLKKRKNTDQP
jgi:hypothetical protein